MNNLYHGLERIAITVMVISLVGLFQPFALFFYSVALPIFLSAAGVFVTLRLGRSVGQALSQERLADSTEAKKRPTAANFI